MEVRKQIDSFRKNLAKLAEKRKALSEYEIEKAVTIAYYQYLYGISIQKLNDELYEVYSKFLKNAELRFKTGESGSIEAISAKAKIKEIETLKAQILLDFGNLSKAVAIFYQTNENIIPEASTSLNMLVHRF